MLPTAWQGDVHRCANFRKAYYIGMHASWLVLAPTNRDTALQQKALLTAMISPMTSHDGSPTLCEKTSYK